MKHKKVRLIARLDIKGPNLIKGIHLEGLRVIGDPQEHAKKYYEQGADELIYIDIVASLYGRSKLPEIVSRTADKVAINTAAVQRPSLINEVSRRFGSQCMVLSIEAKKQSDTMWEVYTDSGREKTGIDVVDWAKEGVEQGAGEILLTSIDYEGTRKGFDIDLIKKITDAVNIPVIASGGMGSEEHIRFAIEEGGADAIAMADILHYERSTINLIREEANKADIGVRKYDA